ncbi:vesicle transport v-SNARE protein [Oesophagostomum dentatum]|uniref:Golgi SNAP receptor complex member 1 n=1 Tax=Oesophagostomum dentatum TaxID=61180 RepID=A0A0B1T278_OESDE|nr:vesicle transport v-SNARE protein [Oesophagostomum dentatum]
MSEIWEGRLDNDEKSVSARQALFETLTQEIDGLLTKLTHTYLQISCLEEINTGSCPTHFPTELDIAPLSALESYTYTGIFFSGRLDNDEKSVSARQALFETLTQEIDGLLTKLTHVNDEMNDVVGAQSSAGWAMNPAVQHTLRRHREILRDYGTEFRRARDNVQQQLQREFLLAGGMSSSSQEGSCLNNRVKGSDLYLKENEHINSCDRLLDEQMSIAMATKENLQRQGLNLRGIGKKMDTLAKKYPMINNVMQKIQYKKAKRCHNTVYRNHLLFDICVLLP